MSEFTEMVFAGLVAGWILCMCIALGGVCYRLLCTFERHQAGLRMTPEEKGANFFLDLICVVFGPLWIGFSLARDRYEDIEHPTATIDEG